MSSGNCGPFCPGLSVFILYLEYTTICFIGKIYIFSQIWLVGIQNIDILNDYVSSALHMILGAHFKMSIYIMNYDDKWCDQADYAGSIDNRW